jgi:ribulose-5-phosphate 4-epimerase/fuculose-1-phosphate aldolase
LVKVDLEGNIVLNNGYEVNAAGFTIHSAVHMAREDAHAVMHLHTDHGVAVATMQEGLLPITQHALFVYHDLAYHDWEGVALDLDERERVVADLGTKNAMLLRNHGTLTAGGSVASCYMPNQGAIDMMEGTFNNPNSWEGLSKVAWPSMLRLANRLDPSYAE